MKDFLIVGAGLFGATFARLAMDAGYSVTVIDKRNHIAGNCYTETLEGISVHTYGPHIFHTNLKHVWDFANRFVSFNHYVNRPKVIYKDQLYSFPINLMTLYQLWGVKTPAEAQAKLAEVKVPIDNPQNLEEWILSQVGHDIYETFIKGYTSKQWLRHPRELPAFIIKRLPIRLTFDDNYFNDPYQGVPIAGYPKMVENMLEGAELFLDTNYLDNREKWNNYAKNIIYTGKIDEFYDYKFGELEYRTLKFETKVLDMPDYQGNAVINYPDIDVKYTRITEHKHFEFKNTEKTVVTWEYPDEWSKEKIPYYPVNNDENQQKFQQYELLAKKDQKLTFGGRLGDYKYFNMDAIIDSAMKKSEKFGF